MHAIAIAFHVLSAVVWVGGMFFAYLALRPALIHHPVLVRGELWAEVLKRFFPWVWISIGVLLVTGIYMIFNLFGGFGGAPTYVNVMLALGVIMMLMFAHAFFAPYRRLQRSLAVKDETAAAKTMHQIRITILINLILGLTVILLATLGSGYG